MNSLVQKFLLANFIWLSACASTPYLTERESGIDASYKLTRIKQELTNPGTTSPGVSFYQKVLSKTLGSHCTLYPNDSAYAQIVRKRCGGGIAVMKSMARFYFEPNAAELNRPVIQNTSGLLFEDLPNDCKLF